MIGKYFCILCSFLITLLFPSYCLAAAWTLAKGTGQMINTFSYYSIQNASTDNGTSKNFSKRAFDIYAEAGISDSLTFGINPTYQSESNTAEVVSGSVFLRKRLWQGEHTVVSLQPLLQFPHNYDTAVYGEVEDSGYTQTELRLLTGYSNSYQRFPYFWNGEIAYRTPLNGATSEWHLDNTFGVRAFPNWLILLQLFSTYRAENIAHTTSITETDGWGNMTTVENALLHTYFDNIVQISVVYPITNAISIQAGTFAHILEQNEQVGNGVLLSVWINF